MELLLYGKNRPYNKATALKYQGGDRQVLALFLYIRVTSLMEPDLSETIALPY